MKKIVIGIGGASGSVYAKLLLKKLALLDTNIFHIDTVFSSNAIINWELENGTFDRNEIPFRMYESNNFFAPFASGSAGYDALVIVPCSMGQVGRIASGISDDLITRAADVMLKERKRLIIVPRETPYNLIHLRNLTTIAEAGGIICPASPSFYSGAKEIEPLLMTVVDRIIDLLGIDQTTYRWGG